MQGAVADSLLLRVKVIDQEYTGYYPQCDNCIPASFWYSNKAEVRDVIVGNFKGKFINFGNLQHAKFVDEFVSDVYIILNEFENSKLKKQLGLEYYANGFIFPKELLCIPNNLLETIKDDVQLEEALYIKDSDQSCFIRPTLDD
ncbi:MAG: hypothetical protein CMP47_03665 [Rickettsiales bacterium]|nr:hypothetical protein [Rickettsiales bacterium]